MTTPRYIRMPDGRLVAVPTPVVSPPEEVEPTILPEPEEREEPEEEVEPRDDGFSDILDVTEEDIIGTEGVALPEEEDNEDLFGVSEEEDMSDLFGVSEEEAMEYPPKPKKPKIRRTTKYYPPPPTTLGGMRS